MSYYSKAVKFIENATSNYKLPFKLARYWNGISGGIQRQFMDF